MSNVITGPAFYLVVASGAAGTLHAEREDGRMAGACTVRPGAARVAVMDLGGMAAHLGTSGHACRPCCEALRAEVAATARRASA